MSRSESCVLASLRIILCIRAECIGASCSNHHDPLLAIYPDNTRDQHLVHALFCPFDD